MKKVVTRSLRLLGNLTVGMVTAVIGSSVPETQFALSIAQSSLSAFHHGRPMPICHALIRAGR